MKINDGGAARRLDEIRRQVGGEELRAFVLPPPAGRIDADLNTLDEIVSLNDPNGSGILIHAGRPVFAYIRDHTGMRYPDDPKGRKKIHFTFCHALREMQKNGRWQRYRLTNRDDDRYLVDIDNGKELDGQTLYPCQYCLGEVRYHCYNQDLIKLQKDKIIQSFKAKEAFRLLWHYFDVFRQRTRNLPLATHPTGYIYNFPKISRGYRESRNYTCEECGVRATSPWHNKLFDTHHVDGNKSKNIYDNLRCLCKLCHSRQPKHEHYRISPEHQGIIENLRQEQGITS